jgi:hypothetical protein
MTWPVQYSFERLKGTAILETWDRFNFIACRKVTQNVFPQIIVHWRLFVFRWWTSGLRNFKTSYLARCQLRKEDINLFSKGLWQWLNIFVFVCCLRLVWCTCRFGSLMYMPFREFHLLLSLVYFCYDGVFLWWRLLATAGTESIAVRCTFMFWTHDQWRWDPQWFPKRRQLVQPTHRVKAQNQNISNLHFCFC